MGTFNHVIERRILSQISEDEQDIWIATIKYLDRLGWQLSWSKQGGFWYLYSSTHLIYTNNRWEIIQSFIYGIIQSELMISFDMEFNKPKLPDSEKKDMETQVINFSLVHVFDELVSINQKIFAYELRLAAPARAASMYIAYKNKNYRTQQYQELEQFADIYEKKLELEEALKLLSIDGIAQLKSSARKLELVPLKQDEQLPIALSFILLHLDKKDCHWYWYKDKWLYFHGDRLIFSAEDRDDFEGFVLGMAYNYARLSDKILDEKIKGTL